MLDKNKLEQQYNAGQRQFSQTKLPAVDLENIFLSRIDLNQANLDHAMLKNADFSDANLAEASLVAADLHQAHLSRINLSNANLSRTDLSKSILTRANMSQACLDQADLTSAILNEANLQNASLLGAKFLDVDLSTVNLAGAVYDGDTSFPADFDPISEGMINQCSVADLLVKINHLFQCSNKYLGSMMSVKYFHASRPDSNWLKQFTIDRKSQVTFLGNQADLVTPEEQQLFQQWLSSFIKSCSLIVKDFEKLKQP